MLDFFKYPTKPTCTFCGFVDHTVDSCYTKHGNPLSYKPKPRNVPNINQSNAHAVETKVDRDCDVVDYHLRFNNKCNVLEVSPLSFTRINITSSWP